MSVRLSFIIATTGRNSLRRMLDSLTKQIGHDDEILVVADHAALAMHHSLVTQDRVFPVECPRGNNWGHTERNFAMPFATGTHIVFGDDDDAFLPGTVDIIKETLERTPPETPVMFRMIDSNGLILWKDPTVRQGNHGTPQFVVPNVPDLLGQFGNRYEGDYDFVLSTLRKHDIVHTGLVWSTEIIYGCRHFGNLPMVPKF